MADRFKKWYKRLPIRIMLTLQLFPFFLLFLISCMIFYSSGKQQYTNLIMKNAQSIVTQCKNTLDQEMEEIRENADGLVGMRVFYTMVNNLQNDRDPIEPVDYLAMTTEMESFLQHYSNYIDTIALYLKDNSIYYAQSNTGSEKGILRYVDYDSLAGHENEWVWREASEILPENCSNDLTYQMALIYPIGNPTTHDIYGCLWIGIRDDVYLSIISNSKVTSGSEMGLIREGGALMAADENMITLLGDDLAITGYLQMMDRLTAMGTDQHISSYTTDDSYILFTPLAIGSTGIIAIIPSEELYMDMNSYSQLLLVLIMSAVLIFAFLYFIIPRYISRPVTDLINQVQRIHTPEEYQPVQVSGYREITDISDGVNDMMERIAALTESVQREMKAKQATQLQYLFAQINPHFLYNTLDCIKSLCACGEIDAAEQMLDQLVVFYRIGVSKGRSFIPITQEVQHVSAYLTILQQRFEDFQFDIQLETGLERAMTLRMILQPIVENALYHGIRPYRTDGTIRLDVRQIGDNVQITVSDDGGGMDEDVLAGIRASLDEPISDYSDQSYGVYGLKNVQDRMQIAYGTSTHIRIQSEVDCGTDVILTIPYEEEHNDENHGSR